MKKRNVHIDVYESIYPYLLAVVSGDYTTQDINKQFCWPDDLPITKEELDDGWTGKVIYVARKSDHRKTMMVFINGDQNIKNKQERLEDLLRTIVHEAGHVVLSTYNETGGSVCTDCDMQEPFCYYLEWVFDCVYKTITKK